MVTLKKELFEQIVSQCRKEFPNEACGILAGKNKRVEKVYAMTNIDKSPATYFMDTKEQFKVMKDMRNLGLEMLGIYHSHLASAAYPSGHDIALALYPETSYVILSLKDKDNPEIRSFKINAGQVIEEGIKIE